MKQECFLIVYTESGDEIHFILMDMIHYDKAIEEFTKFTNSNLNDLEEFLNYCYKNTMKNFYIQTYCNEPWVFGKYDIKHIMSIPEFGN